MTITNRRNEHAENERLRADLSPFDANMNWTGSNSRIELSECIDGTIYSITGKSNYTGQSHYYYEIFSSWDYGLNWRMTLSQRNSNYLNMIELTN